MTPPPAQRGKSEVRTERDIRAELGALELRVRHLRKELRKRKCGRLGHVIRRGMGSRDRDEDLKRTRGYTDPSSYVRRDGSEKLVGEDWRARKAELWYRSGGLCEANSGEFGGFDRCCKPAIDPHHLTRRSVRRDDRLTNLQALCRFHHDLLDPRNTRWSKAGK